MKKRKQKRNRFLALLIVAAIAAGWAWTNSRPDYGQAYSYLGHLETKNVKSILKNMETKEKDILKNQFKDGSITFEKLFSRAVFLGDSRVKGFGDYGFLPSDRLFAFNGADLRDVKEYLGQLEQMQPEFMILAYGTNDLALYHICLPGTSPTYGELLEEQMDQVLAVAPNCRIVVNSIIHSGPDGTAQNPDLFYIDDFNAQMKEVCQRRGWVYVDNDQICEKGNAPIYVEDQFHFIPEFYPVWEQTMLDAISHNVMTETV